MPRARRPEYDSAEFRHRFEDGETLESLAEWLGVHVTAVFKAVHRRGLKPRERGHDGRDYWRCDACAMLGRGLGVEDIAVRLSVDVADVRRLVSALRASGKLRGVLATGRVDG